MLYLILLNDTSYKGELVADAESIFHWFMKLICELIHSDTYFSATYLHTRKHTFKSINDVYCFHIENKHDL